MEYTREEQCQEQVHSDGFARIRQCQKKATVKRDGKSYCKIHDPEYQKEKQRKWEEKFGREHTERQVKYHRQEVIHKVCESLPTEWLETNANLIAAAPDMYEALKLTKDTVITKTEEGYLITYDALRKIIKALAKAEGK